MTTMRVKVLEWELVAKKKDEALKRIKNDLRRGTPVGCILETLDDALSLTSEKLEESERASNPVERVHPELLEGAKVIIRDDL